MKKQICLNLVEDVKSFVSEIRTLKGDVIGQQRHSSIDCTSILGLFSLDLSQPFSVEFIGDDIETARFDEITNKYAV